MRITAIFFLIMKNNWIKFVKRPLPKCFQTYIENLHENEKERLRELYREFHEKKENIHRINILKFFVFISFFLLATISSPVENTQVSPLHPNMYEPIV
jgi:hypothetical protein